VADLHRVLTPDGLYTANIIDWGRQAFLKAEIRTVAAEFAHVAVISKANDHSGGNFVLVASDQPIDAAAIRGLTGARASVLADAAEVRSFVGDAPLLTDDYAPVDQLLTPYRQ
jgi:hypothetical protein